MLPTLALVLAMLIWGSSFIAMKVALRAFDPMPVVLGRMLVASLVFLLFWRRLRQVSYVRGDWKYLAFMALCEPCLYFLFEAHALRLTSASQAGMVTAVLPLLTAIAAGILLKEKITARTLAGFLLAMAGVVWLSLAGRITMNAPNPVLGNVLEFLAMVCATGYIVTMKYLTRRYSPLFITAFQAFCGAVFFLPVLFLPGTEIPARIPLVPSLAVVYLGTFVTMAAYGLYNYGTSKIPAGQASAFVNLIPVITLVMGRVLLKEAFTTQQFFASGLVLAGVFLSRQRRIL